MSPLSPCVEILIPPPPKAMVLGDGIFATCLDLRTEPSLWISGVLKMMFINLLDLLVN